MVNAGMERGAAVALCQWQRAHGFEIPEGAGMFHLPGPVLYRQISHRNQDWLIVYEGEHDGTGWLNTRTYRRPLVYLPGDFLSFRGRLFEDRGPTVVCEFTDDKGNSITRELPRKSIVFVEEQPHPAAS